MKRLSGQRSPNAVLKSEAENGSAIKYFLGIRQ
jgi:hypothetical protein